MTAKKKNRTLALIVCAVILLVLIIWTVWGNTALERAEITITGKTLPKSFDGYRIAHVSDLHNTQIGKDNAKLLALLRDAQPDIIAITGDLIDSRNTDLTVALQFAEAAVKIAPCYYVTGNHEVRIAEYDALKKGLTELGVIVLSNDSLEIRRSGECVTLLGVDDPSFQTAYLSGDSASVMQNALQQIPREGYSILLSHRPELFDVYAENSINLVLSGHAHGGQFRIPFLGGIIAPNQGFFPEYDAGLFTKGTTSMVVSRGIGNSLFPVRFNNRPEVVFITLESP